MSLRDVAIALGVSRQEISRWVWMSQLPKEDLEAYLAQCEAEDRVPRSREIELLARRQAGNESLERERRCPHCGKPLWFEGAGEILEGAMA